MLTRVDGCPLQEDQLTFELKSWLAVTGDTINSSFTGIETALNLLTAQSMTQAQIIALSTSVPPGITNGILLYDTTNNVYVGMQNNALVKFTTTSYP